LVFVCLVSACNAERALEAAAPTCVSAIAPTPPGASTVNGQFTGPDFAGVFCEGGVTAFIQQPLGAPPAPSYFFTVGHADACVVQNPPDVDNCGLQVQLEVGSPQPTTVSNAHGGGCDHILLGAGLVDALYVGQASGICGSTGPFAEIGAWKLTIDSVAPDSAAGAMTDALYVTHGSLNATLVSAVEAGLGASTEGAEVQLAITF
jgi:hypothetical protein